MDLDRGMRKKQRRDGDARTDCRVPLKEDVKLAQRKRRVIKLKRGKPRSRNGGVTGDLDGVGAAKGKYCGS